MCFDRGENLCPLKDDRDKLINKMISSDGIIFASPNYSFQVSGLMKVFIDRIAFFLNRPQFFGKTYSSIVAQGVFGGSKIIKYLSSIGDGLGYNVIKGCCIKTLEPISEKQEAKNKRTISKLSEKFYSQLIKEEYPTPSILKLMIFRITRSKIKRTLNKEYQDYKYYRDKGWFDSSYYYPIKLNPIKKLAGNIFDGVTTKIS